MITRRQYVAIVLIFLVVFLLFQGLQLGKMYFSNANVNKHVRENDMTSSDSKEIADPPIIGIVSQENSSIEVKVEDETKPYVLFVGRKNTEIYNTVTEWAYYADVQLYHSRFMPSETISPLPQYIILDKAAVVGESMKILRFLRLGTNIIFAEIPDVTYIESHNIIRMILGIYKIRAKTQELHGIRLFKGFFIGGDRIFDIEDPVEPDDKRQDLTLNIPWYRVRPGTETYMQGILNDEDMASALKNKLKNEDMPAIIWRHHYQNGEVFAVNGEYMKNRQIGIGILAAFMHQANDYSIYPVVNARVFSLGNYPILTDENNDLMLEKYGDTLTNTEKDVVLPMLTSLSTNSGILTTCFMSPRYNYNERLKPQNGELTYYLDMLFEMDGELGLSGMREGNRTLAGKLKDAEDYYTADNQIYNIASAYLSADELSDFSEQYKKSESWKDIKTVVSSGYTDKEHIIGYLDADITYQQSNMDPDYHTFTDDLELIGVYTLLGYNNATYDMTRTFYPEEKRDEWQNTSIRLFSNIVSYNSPYKAFDSVTSGKCDFRIRNYLSLSYSQKRADDTIYVSAEGFDDHAYFLLRLHNEEIDSVDGGTFKKIETDAYLIDITENSVQIHLKNSLDSLIKIGGNR